MKQILILITVLALFFLIGCQQVLDNEEEGESEIPEGCILWFDGCNNCMVEDGKITGCTKKECKKTGIPRCLEYEGDL